MAGRAGGYGRLKIGIRAAGPPDLILWRGWIGLTCSTSSVRPRRSGGATW